MAAQYSMRNSYDCSMMSCRQYACAASRRIRDIMDTAMMLAVSICIILLHVAISVRIFELL